MVEKRKNPQRVELIEDLIDCKITCVYLGVYSNSTDRFTNFANASPFN